MSYDIEKALTEQLGKAVTKHIDIEAMAKRVAPRVSKAIEEGIVKAVANFDYDEAITDGINYSQVGKAISAALVNCIQRVGK